MTLLTFGLAKKVFLADFTGQRIGEAFFRGHRRKLESLPVINAWYAVLAYPLQIYFDFSGYTDMAIGLARLFNIVLPQGFNYALPIGQHCRVLAPLAHDALPLSRDYLYIPAGETAMAACAGIEPDGDHVSRWPLAWRELDLCCVGRCMGSTWSSTMPQLETKDQLRWLSAIPSLLRSLTAHALTLLAVMLAWVLFRADNFPRQSSCWRHFFGTGCRWWPTAPSLSAARPERLVWLMVLYAMVLLAPNSQDILLTVSTGTRRQKTSRHPGLLGGRLLWQPTTTWAVYIAIVLRPAFSRSPP